MGLNDKYTVCRGRRVPLQGKRWAEEGRVFTGLQYCDKGTGEEAAEIQLQGLVDNGTVLAGDHQVDPTVPGGLYNEGEKGSLTPESPPVVGEREEHPDHRLTRNPAELVNLELEALNILLAEVGQDVQTDRNRAIEILSQNFKPDEGE